MLNTYFSTSWKLQGFGKLGCIWSHVISIFFSPSLLPPSSPSLPPSLPPSQSDLEHDDLNKTLPKNFRFPSHHHTSSHGNLLSPNSTMQSPPNRISPVRSVGSTSRGRSTSIQRRPPVAGTRPNLSRYARNYDKEELGRSDPAIARHVSW